MGRPRKLIEIGATFGTLTVLENHHTIGGYGCSACLCYCSEFECTGIVRNSDLKNGATTSGRKFERDKAPEGSEPKYEKEIIEAGSWYSDSNGYYVRYVEEGSNDERYLHCFIWALEHGPIPEGMVVDHKKSNPSNNLLSNLQLITPRQNKQKAKMMKNNTSGEIGVGWREDCKKWRARITVDGKQENLGYFTTKEEAVKVRREAEVKYFGDYTPVRDE